jgi:POT family proton-dependent oligopeptide transporter
VSTSAIRASEAIQAANIRAGDETFLGHPKGLFVLFFAEMWERFSFYGMRGLLIFYLTKHFLFADAAAAAIYASYGSLVYLTPLIGGIVADRWLGFRKAVAFGAFLLVIGHLGMAFEGAPAAVVGTDVVRDPVGLQTFYLSLAFIIIGCGLLKPNISSMVGRLYGPDDFRRDSGFTIFYLGINIGAAVSGLLCGYLGETYGWAYGFGAAGIGMMFGLATFVYWQDLYAGTGEAPDQAVIERRYGPLKLEHWIYVGAVASVAVVWLLIQNRESIGVLLNVLGLAAVGWIIWFSVTKCERVERDRMLVVLFLTTMSMFFWACFEQAGSSMNLFADRNVDRNMFGYVATAAQFQSVNPLFIMLMAVAFASLWLKLGERGLNPSTGVKFGLALLQISLGFMALVFGISQAQDGIVHWFWLILAYFLHTTGELCLSPVGLSMVTRLSVARVVGLMMGVWFLFSGAFAHFVAGIIAAAASIQTEPGEQANAVASAATYGDVFWQIALISAGVGVFVLAVSPIVKRFAHEEN